MAPVHFFYGHTLRFHMSRYDFLCHRFFRVGGIIVALDLAPPHHGALHRRRDPSQIQDISGMNEVKMKSFFIRQESFRNVPRGLPVVCHAINISFVARGIARLPLRSMII